MTDPETPRTYDDDDDPGLAARPDPETPQTAADFGIAACIQPVIDAWMDGDHGGVIYTRELTDLIVEALTVGNAVALYNAGYKSGRAARDAEVRALVERLEVLYGNVVSRRAVLAILSDTPETGSDAK